MAWDVCRVWGSGGVGLGGWRLRQAPGALTGAYGFRIWALGQKSPLGKLRSESDRVPKLLLTQELPKQDYPNDFKRPLVYVLLGSR